MFRSKASVSLEEQLENLAELGLTLNPEIGEEQLTIFSDRESLESDPYHELVEVMGRELAEEPYTPLCNALWMCDSECIVDHGDYKRILQRLELMTSQALQAENTEDYVSIEDDIAWLEFDHQGQRVCWDFEVSDDWLDLSIVVRYDQLLKSSGAPVRIYSNLREYGQVVFLGAFEPEQKTRFDKLSRVKLTALPRR